MEALGGNWKAMEQLERGFFVYCRELGREEDNFRVGTAMMTDVGGDRSLDTLYIMIPVEVEQARKIERILLIVDSSERVVEVGVDRESQRKIERRVSDESR